PVFTGNVQRRAITGENNAKRLYLGLVKFSPGARTVWHTHTFEQGLVIVEGKGIVATEQHEHVVEPGDVILIPEGENHWHGATESTGMGHISIGGSGQTIPGEPVKEIKTKNP
ncbi:MAG TPA: cupin domain-containing protein, partial [Dehalococcoidia bacterium]|nr:cupin domain-containing protein [Dehalococcoidia bacterium]